MMIKSEILKSHSSIPHTDEVIIACEDESFQKTEQKTRILGPEESKQLAQNQVLVSDFKKQKLEKEAQKNWDLFYKRNSTNFFKDRHWTTREFEELKACRKFEDQKLTILEAGCGVGNCLFPLLEEDLNVFAYACDFSPRAVEYVKQNSLYDTKRCKVFLCDLTKDDLVENVPLESVDVVMLIFVLSAIHPEKIHLVLHNIYKVLKPGKYVLFRDYGLHDHAMLRFKSACKLGENFYVRQDGTRSYFFSDAFLAELFLSVGYEEIVNEYVFRETLNKKKTYVCQEFFSKANFESLKNKLLLISCWTVEVQDYFLTLFSLNQVLYQHRRRQSVGTDKVECTCTIYCWDDYRYLVSVFKTISETVSL